MTLYNRRKKKLIEQLKDKEYRDAFVVEHIDTGVPFQIKTLRNQRKWTQKKLANLAKMEQPRISVLEDPNYSKLSLSTLKKLASVFEVGLIVRFVPISELVEWELNLSSESLKAIGFKEDTYFQKEAEQDALAHPATASALKIEVDLKLKKTLSEVTKELSTLADDSIIPHWKAVEQKTANPILDYAT